jgi:hypothetical protein|tara:strand:- start:238 stop:1344 length:1107 start_codon:yes stop_codon:yes gene_type:complete
MAMSETQSRTVRLSECRKYVKHHAKKKRPMMIWGPPGIGKSDLVAGVCSEYPNSYLIDVRLPLWEPTDIKGIPYYNAKENNMTWAAPSELPTEEFAAKYDTIFLFLDELNGGAPAVQAAAYQLILNRKVGTYKLPDNVVIVAAGNRETDKGVTYRMPKPLANRFVHYEIRVDFEDWLTWATNNDISPDVVGYLTFSKSDLYNFDPSSNERSFATPRSWAFVSELLDDVEDFSDEEITDMVSGAIGEGTALKFKAHRAVASKLPNPTLILKGEVTTLKTKEISAMYSLSTSMAYELKAVYDQIGRDVTKEEFDGMLDNVLGFMMKNFDPEMIIMATRLVFVQYGVTANLRKMSNWPEFMKNYGHLIKEA